MDGIAGTKGRISSPAGDRPGTGGPSAPASQPSSGPGTVTPSAPYRAARPVGAGGRVPSADGPPPMRSRHVFASMVWKKSFFGAARGPLRAPGAGTADPSRARAAFVV